MTLTLRRIESRLVQSAAVTDIKVERLHYLSNQLSRHSHLQDEPSDEMYSWIDEYDGIKEEDPEAWTRFCKKYGVHPDSDSGDALA